MSILTVIHVIMELLNGSAFRVLDSWPTWFTTK